MEIVSEILNNRLIEKQGLSLREVKTLEDLHKDMENVINLLNSLEFNEENKQQIFQLTKSIEILEFTMQKVWKFRQDSNYHIHWLRNKNCSCPRLDNLDYLYYGSGKIHRSDCKIHGKTGINPALWEKNSGN